MITKEAEFSTKEEGSTNDSKTSKPSSSSTSWSRLKDPRIVRVSRAFGGKDRHSKVCTVRGLRDRRVRLSVPTAIQLYDLQDRLGLNQPSKVVDWLLNAAKHEIDGLPPLQMPPGNFPQNLHQMLASHHGIGASQSDKGLKTSSSINWDDPSEQPRLNIMDSDATLRTNPKEVRGETTDDKDQNWTRNEEEKDCNLEGHHGAYASSNNFFQRPNHSSLAGLMNNSMPYNSFLRWDPSNLSLSHGGSHGLPPQPEEFRNFNIATLPSAVNMASGSQVVVYPPGVAHSYFPSNISATEFDPKHINLQMLSSSSQNPLSNSLTQPVDSSSQPVRPFHFSMMANLLPSHDNSGTEPNKDNDFDSR